MMIKTKASSGVQSAPATAASALMGLASKTGVQIAISTSPFRREPVPLATPYVLRGGTSKADQISVTGATAVFAGPGSDTLTGISRLSADRQWTLFPFLSGGPGNDRYNVAKGNSVVIADMNGGNDVVSISGILVNNIRYFIINKDMNLSKRGDMMITDGATSVLLLDPLGSSSPLNKIESIVVNGVRKTMSQYFDEAENSYSFNGVHTYASLERVGLFNSDFISLENPELNDFAKSPVALNNLMIF